MRITELSSFRPGGSRPPHEGRLPSLATRASLFAGRIVCFVALLAVAPFPALSALSQQEVASWIISEGGTVARNTQGDVTAVDLQSSWITDGDLEKIASLQALEDLNLSYTWITDLGMEHLAALENVKRLNLYYTEYIGDGAIAHIQNWKNLEYLNVCGT
jgi:hypothetical protein